MSSGDNPEHDIGDMTDKSNFMKRDDIDKIILWSCILGCCSKHFRS